MGERSVKLICTDFDGTIHDERSDPPIAATFERAIMRLQQGGAKWLINTGRELSSLLEELARSGIRARPDYLVVVEREIHVLERARYVAYEPWNERCGQVHRRLFADIKDEIPALFDWVNQRYEVVTYEDEWSPFCVITNHADETGEIVRYLERWAGRWADLAVVHNDVYTRLSHRSFNKGTALREVARLCSAGPEVVFAAGDHYNDLPMFDVGIAAGQAAPANAMPEIRELVLQNGGIVDRSESGAGTAAALEKWLTF